MNRSAGRCARSAPQSSRRVCAELALLSDGECDEHGREDSEHHGGRPHRDQLSNNPRHQESENDERNEPLAWLRSIGVHPPRMLALGRFWRARSTASHPEAAAGCDLGAQRSDGLARAFGRQVALVRVGQGHGIRSSHAGDG